MQQELDAETEAREKLEEQFEKTKDAVSQAEAAEKATRQELDTATAKRAELECQAAAAQSDADSARRASKQAQQQLSASQALMNKLKEGGKGFSAELRRRAELWDKVMTAGLPAGQAALEEATCAEVAPTVQATCLVDEVPTKSQHGDTQGAASEAVEAVEEGVNDVKDRATAMAGGIDPKQREDGSQGAQFDLARQATVIAVDIEEAACEPAGGQRSSEASRPLPEIAPGAHAPSFSNATSSPGLAAAAGSSTAWSLEVLDIVEPALEPPHKKAKR